MIFTTIYKYQKINIIITIKYICYQLCVDTKKYGAPAQAPTQFGTAWWKQDNTLAGLLLRSPFKLPSDRVDDDLWAAQKLNGCGMVFRHFMN